MSVTIDLALQGGGAHGAFTWGVLDRLLEENDIDIAAVSGTSAGAMNAAVLVEGLRRGGARGAQTLLCDFWKEISRLGALFNPLRHLPIGGLQGFNLDWSLSYNLFEIASLVMSPYQFNPLNINPLRYALSNILGDINKLREGTKPHLFITATNVQTGQARVFSRKEVTLDVILASACIPTLFQAVNIDGVPYWDGGYMGNPVISPLIDETACSDILLVQINPTYCSNTPMYSDAIVNRLNEITFNSSLISQLKNIERINTFLTDGQLKDSKYRALRLHRIAMRLPDSNLNASSKLNARWDFFVFLRDKGREAADAWLRQHKNKIGKVASATVADFLVHTESSNKNEA